MFALVCIACCYSAAKAPWIRHDREHFLLLGLHYLAIGLGIALLLYYQHTFWTDPQWRFPLGFFAFPIAAIYFSCLSFKKAST